MPTVEILAVFSGYLLGSIPSARILARLNRISLGENTDGQLGASLAFRRLGIASGFVVVLLDLGKGVAAVAVAQALDVPGTTILLAGFAVVIGHNWSLFLGFKGGRGTLASYGVMAALAFWQFFIALILALVVFYFIRKATLATVILFTALAFILFVQDVFLFTQTPFNESLWFAMFPLILLVPNFLKYAQLRKQKVRVISQKGGTTSRV